MPFPLELAWELQRAVHSPRGKLDCRASELARAGVHPLPSPLVYMCRLRLKLCRWSKGLLSRCLVRYSSDPGDRDRCAAHTTPGNHVSEKHT